MKKEKRLKNKSIRRKLITVFLVVVAVQFAVNVYVYFYLNNTIRRIDSVYNSNIKLNDLAERLDNLQNNLFQYLNTKSSTVLEEYYVSKQEYEDEIGRLNTVVVDNESSLMEKNIANMSHEYLEVAEKAVDAKRGRNIAVYKEVYESSEELYSFLQSNINSLNTIVFKQNSDEYAVLRNALNVLIVISAVFLTLAIVVALAWIVLVTRGITRPLVDLANSANEIAKGNMDVDFPMVHTGDEIETVSKASNKMITSIRSYISETRANYERESKMKETELIMKNDLKEAELKYLQAQINPHFLFNTLNAGAQLAMMEGAEKTYVFIENMADFFRYNVRKMDKNTTLEEEIHITDNYIYIMNVRFSGQINFKKTIDNRLIKTRMPSMIIQPIIENAFNHGIREMEEDGEIELLVYASGEDVCISIADNGDGIDETTAKRIMEGENLTAKEKSDVSGIGLYNVINRLKQFYGREDVFTIRRREAGGTEVILRLSGLGGYNENTNL